MKVPPAEYANKPVVAAWFDKINGGITTDIYQAGDGTFAWTTHSGLLSDWQTLEHWSQWPHDPFSQYMRALPEPDWGTRVGVLPTVVKKKEAQTRCTFNRHRVLGAPEVPYYGIPGREEADEPSKRALRSYVMSSQREWPYCNQSGNQVSLEFRQQDTDYKGGSGYFANSMILVPFFHCNKCHGEF